MAPNAVLVNEILDTLNDQDYNTVIEFIQFLSNKRKFENAKKNSETLKNIQTMFADNKGLDSAESMIADMATFRRERMGL